MYLHLDMFVLLLNFLFYYFYVFYFYYVFLIFFFLFHFSIFAFSFFVLFLFLYFLLCMYLHLDMLDLLKNFSFQYFDVHHLYYVTLNLLVLMHFSIVADSFFELFHNQWLYSYFLYFVYHFSLYPECFYFLVLPLQFVTIINLKPTTMKH